MLRADPVGPRITYYDDATGERIELSASRWPTGRPRPATCCATSRPWPVEPGGGAPAGALADRGGAVRGVVDRRRGRVFGGDRVPTSRSAPSTGSTGRRHRRDGGRGPVAGRIRPAGADLPIGVTDYATAVRVHGDQSPASIARSGVPRQSVDEVLDACYNAAARDLLRRRVPRPRRGDARRRDRRTARRVVARRIAGLRREPRPAALARRTETEKVTRSL